MVYMCMISDTSSEAKNNPLPTNRSQNGKLSQQKLLVFLSLIHLKVAPHHSIGMDLNGVEPGNFGSLNI